MRPSLRMARKRSPCAEMTTNGEYITRCVMLNLLERQQMSVLLLFLRCSLGPDAG